MTLSQLTAYIRTIINEATVETDEFTAETDAAIRESILAAMKQIAIMPGTRITPVAFSDESAVVYQQRPDGLFYAVITPPAEFLAPVSVKLSEWRTPVYSFLPISDGAHLAQFSSARGVGNGPAMPIAFISTDQTTLIQAHAITQSPNVILSEAKNLNTYTLQYIPTPTISEEGEIQHFPAELYHEPLAYTAAALYLQSINEYNAAKTAFDTAGAYIQNLNQS